MNKYIIFLHAGTPPQRDAIAGFIRDKGWQSWHWIDDAWLIADVPSEMTPRTLWLGLIEAPLLTSMKGLVLKMGDGVEYWGGNAPESWPWLAREWGKPDFPTPPAV